MAKVEGDAELVKRIDEVAKVCEVFPAEAMLHTCPKGEDRAVEARARELPKGAALLTAIDYVKKRGHADPRKLAAALAALKSMIPGRDRTWLEANTTPEVGDRLLELVGYVPESAAPGIGAVIAGGAIFGGKREALTAALEQRKPGTPIRAEVYAHYLDFAGADALGDIERLTRSSNATERYRALTAVGIAVYRDPSGKHPSPPDDVREKLCGFARPFVGHADADLAAGARDALNRCGGADLDLVLADLERRLETGPLDPRQLDGARRTCWSEGWVDKPANGSPEQCARTLGVFERQLRTKGLSGEPVRAAIVHVGSIGKYLDAAGKARARALLTGFAKNPDRLIAEATTYARGQLK